MLCSPLAFLSKTNIKSNHFILDLGEKTTLLFDHAKEEMSTTNEVQGHFDQIMGRLVSKDKLSASQDSAHEFTSLVFLLRKMDEKRMKSVWNKYFDCMKSGVCDNEDLRDVYR